MKIVQDIYEHPSPILRHLCPGYCPWLSQGWTLPYLTQPQAVTMRGHTDLSSLITN